MNAKSSFRQRCARWIFYSLTVLCQLILPREISAANCHPNEEARLRSEMDDAQQKYKYYGSLGTGYDDKFMYWADESVKRADRYFNEWRMKCGDLAPRNSAPPPSGCPDRNDPACGFDELRDAP